MRDSPWRLGLAGLCIALSGIAAHVSAALLFLAGYPGSRWLSPLAGVSGLLVGFLLYGVATLRAGMLPRWYGLTLAVGVPVSLGMGRFVAPYWSSLLFGLIFLALGYALRSRRSTAAEGASRVS